VVLVFIGLRLCNNKTQMLFRLDGSQNSEVTKADLTS
jgi:hypothetical protein